MDAGTSSVRGGPIAGGERITALDILRGFALSGVLVVNLSYAVGPSRTALDRLAHAAVEHFASGAFYPMFAFLFGMGFTLQMERAAAKGASFERIYRCRLLVLLGFGLAHMAFLWWGDIVWFYSILGFALLLFRRCSVRSMVACAAILWTFSLVESPLIRALHIPRLHVTSEQTDKRLGEELENAYGSGSYAQVVRARVRWIPVHMDRILTDDLVPNVLAFFLLGAAAARSLLPLGDHRRELRRVLAICMASAAATAVEAFYWPESPAATAFKTALAGCYAAGLGLLLVHDCWLRRLGLLSFIGRMSLTNYLMQSLMFTTVLYGYGFGQYKKLGRAAALALAIGFYLLQIGFSYLWLKRFTQGPAERIWRTLSYRP